MTPLRLSTDDLGFFLEERHHGLATDLRRIGEHHRAEDAHDARGVAKALGQKHGLYAFLVPEKLGGFPVGHPDEEGYVAVRSLCLIRELLGQVSALGPASTR